MTFSGEPLNLNVVLGLLKQGKGDWVDRSYEKCNDDRFLRRRGNKLFGYLGEEKCRQKESLLQRPRGGNMPGLLKAAQEANVDQE